MQLSWFCVQIMMLLLMLMLIPRPEDALHVFPYQVCEAAFLNGPDRTLFLFLLQPTAASLRVLQLSRAEGFRGQEVANSNQSPN